jgi:tRNA pseudouridine55 synthase
MSGVTLAAARAAAAGLTGDIMQVPPMVSALKVGGRRLHELARAGIEVERAPRRVTVMRFEVELATPGESCGPGAPGGPVAPGGTVGPGPGAASGPVLAIDVECSSGTYVRTLAADLGAALGGGAHLRRLRRVTVGGFTVSDAVTLGALQASPAPASAVLRPADALADMARAVVFGETVAAVGHGKVLPLRALEEAGARGAGPWAVVSEDGTLLAVYTRFRAGEAKPVVVLGAAGN